MDRAALDRRLTPFSGRVALESLRGVVTAEFTAGQPGAVAIPLADLLAQPDGARDRQVVFGEPMRVIDRRDGHAFVQMGKDGYCGWLADAAIGPALVPTHRVAAPASHLYPEPRVQARERFSLPFGALLRVTDMDGTWARGDGGFVPAKHMRPVDDLADDPVQVAELFLGTPYLWGGNSRDGIDCSGLVQAALLSCGISCPGDSDLQAALGAEVTGPLQRGDLVFWKGHVALVTGPDRIIHANGHSMDVRHEGLADATARIAGQGGGPITARRRV